MLLASRPRMPPSLRPEAVQRRSGGGDLNPSLGEHLLHVAQAERETEIEPNRVSDHLGREPVALERNLAVSGDFLALD
jgi:hypothetical protein